MYDENNQAEETKYEEHLRKKEKFNELAIMHTSTDDALKRRQREEKRARLESWLAIAGLGGAAYGTAILINKNPELAEFLSKLPGANRYAKKHDAAYKNSLGFGVKPTDLRSHYLDQSFGRSMISFISSLEELSPFGILKTLQLSNILEPLTDISRTPKDIHITGSALKSSSDYYDKLIKYASDGKYNLTDNDLKRGMVLRGSQLLRMNADGTLDEANPILKHARSVTSHVKMGESIAPNRLWNKFAAVLDTNLGFNSYSKEQVGIIAGKSWTDLATKWTNAGFMHSMEIGYKTLDNPLGGVEELLRATGVGAIGADRGADGKIISDGIFDSELYRKIKSKLNLNLGTGGNYNLTTSKAVPKMVKNLVGKSVGLYVGYQAINQVLDFVTPDSSIWSDGLISGFTANYANLRVGAAKILADPFQRYKEAQENAADGSTSLLTLAGFPIAGATAGASLAWYKRMKDSALEGIESASDIGSHRIHKYGFANSLASKLKLEDTSISKKWAFQGAVIGAAIALPFLPGALIGESSEELKKSYSGEKLEAYRANAGWLAGSQSYEGGHIKAFVPSRVARILSGARDEVRYDGDNDLKRKMDPIYSPLSYLKNPYQYEEMHQDDMPYPVWGMSVNYGSFLGKIYQGTVGEMIKPTVINPQFLEDSRLIRTNAIQGYREAIQADVGTENESAQYTYNKESAYSPLARLGSIANYFGVSGGDGEFPITTHAATKERQMIDAGMMLAEQSPSSDPYSIAAAQTYNALSDFTGLKGFTSSLVVNKLGYNPEDVRRQLARSGDSRSAATDFLDENVGDALGCFTPEMRVVTKKGYKEIQHIQTGDLVLSKGGVYRPVKNIFKREFTNITILELHITGIDVVIRLTPDHKLNFIINHNHQLIEMIKHKAVYLTSGDYLIHPLCDDSLNKLNKELLIYRYNNNLYLPLRDVEIKYYTGYIYDLEIDRNDTDNSRTVNDINYYVVEGIEFSNSGEFIRRVVPMSAGARVDDVNPMKNDQVSWLPSGPSKFHIDFSTGNSYGKIALGEDRLPKGYAEYHTELKGMDPEDFPLVHQYNILSDVASGSPEQLALKTHLLKAEQEGKLSDRERDMFYTTLTQEQAKRQRKQFSEYKTSEEFSQLSVGGKALNKLWEFAAHKAESPLETMTPFRPGAKFIHKRSAIEDYEMTMLHGPDTGIWSNPFSHFIRPAMNRSFDLITPGTHKPKHAEERDNVEEYFDKLEYLKARMHGRTNDVMRTTHGATATGILDTAGYNKFRSAVGDKQRDYVDTFAQKTDHSERRKILEMLPTDVAAGYKRIWENLDVAEKAKSRGADINEAVENSYIRSSMRHLLNSKYKEDRFATEIDQAVKESRQLGAMKGKDYDRRQDLLAKARELRLRDADREAVAYISARTGVPGQDWIGWDPRLKLDEIKLRTLKIGKADTYDYGFWDSDLQRNSRIIALDDEDEVTKSYNQIKSTMRSDTIRKNNIERSLFNNGIFARRVTLSEANQNNTELRIEE